MSLVCKELKKYYPIKSGLFSLMRSGSRIVRAVDNVDLQIEKGSSFGLVGESGCGKTTLGYLILRLVQATGGKVLFEGKNVFNLNHSEMLKLRRDMQIIFQDPDSSLDPRMTVEKIIKEPLKTHKMLGDKEEVRKTTVNLLEKLELHEGLLKRYPHELSGGQKQRVLIVRMLVVNPKFVVLDEPTSALDVVIQAKVLNILDSIRKELELSYLLISHDMSVVKHMCDHIGVMYLGKIVEQVRADNLLKGGNHPYVKYLISSIPNPDPRARSLTEIKTMRGDVPNATNIPSGCRFHPRCPYAMPKCKVTEPELIDVGQNHLVACHLFE